MFLLSGCKCGLCHSLVLWTRVCGILSFDLPEVVGLVTWYRARGRRHRCDSANWGVAMIPAPVESILSNRRLSLLMNVLVSEREPYIFSWVRRHRCDSTNFGVAMIPAPVESILSDRRLSLTMTSKCNFKPYTLRFADFVVIRLTVVLL